MPGPDDHSITDPAENARLQKAHDDYMKERSKPWRVIGAYEETIRFIKVTLESDGPMRGKLTQIKAAIGANDRIISKMTEEEA